MRQTTTKTDTSAELEPRMGPGGMRNISTMEGEADVPYICRHSGYYNPL